jgi:AraC-like DNA-binding protein
MKKSAALPIHTLPGFQFMASNKSMAFGEHAAAHRIEFYALIWFTETKGTHYIDFEPYPIRKNEVYFIAPHQVHTIPNATLPKARVIVCSTEFFDRVEELHLRQLFLPFNNSGISIPANTEAPLTHLFNLILQEYQTQAYLPLLLLYTKALLMHLYRVRWQQQSSAALEDTRITKLLRLLETYYKEERSTTFYARELGLTSKRVNELLRERMGGTISELLNRLVLLEAKRALFHQQQSIKEIAYDLGFTDQSYFARFFRKQTGFTPEAFRKQSITRSGT